MRRFILAFAGLLACCCAAAGGVTKAVAAGQSSTKAGQEKARLAAISWLGGQIRGYQQTTWRWEHVMGARLTPTAGRVLTEMSVPDVKRAVLLWRHRAHAAHRRAEHPPHMRAFLCIHHYEASWTDTGAPYYGGLQMDLGFQHTYAPWLLRMKGTANHWTPLEQIWTAEKALKTRGFWPWPNTARFCGLL
ncbi:MAG TPA: hypothetical protein VF091_02095 [Gaiellaceae bacterium]